MLETPSGSAPNVLCCLDAMKSYIDNAWRMFSVVSLTENVKSSSSEMDGGG